RQHHLRLGAPPGRKSWEVSVEDPHDPRKIGLRLELRDQALSVAGRAYKSFERDGVSYSHIMDPRIGRPVPGRLSVVVLSETGTAGAALDDASSVLGPAKTRASLKRLPRTSAVFFEPRANGRWHAERLAP